MADVVRITSDRTIEVAGRTFPATFTIENIDPPGVEYRTRRARVLFEGAQVGVSWGTGSHSDNRDHRPGMPFTEEPEHVEVALFPDDGPVMVPHVGALTLRVLLGFIAGGRSVETIVEAWRVASSVGPCPGRGSSPSL